MVKVDNVFMPQNAVSLPNIGAIVVIVCGFAMIAIGKETQTVVLVVGLAAGFLFGTHTNKPPARR